MEAVKSRHGLLTSVSVVFVVENDVPDRQLIENLSAEMATTFNDFEFILVANGAKDQTTLALKKLIAELPDSTCVFVGERLDTDIARIVGIDHSIGDYVLLLTNIDIGPSIFAAMVKAANEGFDLVIVRGRHLETQSRWFYDLSRRLFLRFLKLIVGIEIEDAPLPLRLLSRQTALHLLNQRHAEILLKSTELGVGFPAKVLDQMNAVQDDREPRTASQLFIKGLRVIVSTGSLLMRLASFTALTASGLALIYSIYIIVIYLIKPDVAPGWTTVSLQVSGMMFLFSIIFALMAEYIIQIYESMPIGHRQSVIREIRSKMTRRSGRLNVINEEGRFQIGTPEGLFTNPSDSTDNKQL